MTNTLPIEIVIKIATYLSQKKKSTCLRVCRSWYAALIPMMYRDVTIQTESQLHQFVEALQSAEASKSLGHHVCTIMVQTSLTPVKIASLPRLCPFVVELAWDVYDWSSELEEVLQEWKYLQRIKTISFHDEGIEIPLHPLQDKITALSIHIGKYPKWMEYVTKIPGLKDLELTNEQDNIESNSSAISLDELELLHKALPRLEHFSMNSIIIQGEMPTHVTPCSSVRHIYLADIVGDLWGEYFAQKYTNLEELQMHLLRTIVWGNDNGIFKEPAMTLARSCRHIKSLTINGFSDAREALPFFEIFQHIGAPIENLGMFGCDRPLYAAVAERFCGSLTHVRLSWRSMTFNAIVEALKVCPLLVELDLYSSSDSTYAEVDRILDYWNQLKHLRLTRRGVRLSDDCSTHSQHGLKTLQLDGDIHQDVFPYLSQRCSRLSEFDFSFYDESHVPSVIYIPNPNIERFSVESFMLKDYVYKLTWIDKSQQTSKQRKCFAEEILRRRDQAAWYSRMKWFRSDEDDYYFSSDELGCLDTLLDKQCKGCRLCGGTEWYPSGKHVIWIQCYNLDAVFLVNA